jgi:hypothetical protein
MIVECGFLIFGGASDAGKVVQRFSAQRRMGGIDD